LNLPEGARARIQAAAQKVGRTESEVARDLIMEGLARLERAALLERVRAAQTAELHARKREILMAMDRQGTSHKRAQERGFRA
jgi:hypothetical protein